MTPEAFYEAFLSICLDPRFDRVMDEFAELSRRVFKAMSRQPVNFIGSHDDIVLPTGLSEKEKELFRQLGEIRPA